MYILSYDLQVAELKRNLELEEMRKFRQMSRPSFVDKNSNEKKKSTPEIISDNDHDDFITDEYTIDQDQVEADHDVDEQDDTTMFLDHYNEE